MDRVSLISVLSQQVNISKEQALKALVLVFDHAKEICPVLRGNINNFLNEEMAYLERTKVTDVAQ